MYCTSDKTPASFALAVSPPLELVLDHIIERKRMDDLSRSIIDRRFSEQKVQRVIGGFGVM